MARFKYFFLLLFLPGIATAYPTFINPDTPTKVDRNFKDVEQEVQHITFFPFVSKTLTQIKNFTPVQVGESLFCSDCVTSNVCVSTGTVKGAFSNISSKTTACQ